MTIKSAMLCVALGLGAGLLPSIGSARGYVEIDVAPPPPREEFIPEARIGYVWAPGYWEWNGRRHVWISGHYIREYRGHRWVADHWDERHGRWYHERGHWE
jgi:hypothetical protein